MKRIIALLLALMLVFALCACGDKSDSANTPENEKNEVKTQESTDKPHKEEKGQKSENSGFELGTVKGVTYENKSLGIGIKVESGWRLLTEDELYETMGIVADTYDNDEIRDIIMNSGTFYDMMALTQGVENINIAVEKLAPSLAAKYSTEDYAKAGLENLPEAYASAGIELVSSEITTVDFAGEEHTAILTHIVNQGVEMYSLCIVFKCGNYFANVTITAATEAGVYEIADMFYAL